MADYRRQWNEYRHYRELTLIALVGLLPFGALVRFVAVRSGVPWIFMLLMFGWLVFLSYGASGMGASAVRAVRSDFFKRGGIAHFRSAENVCIAGCRNFRTGDSSMADNSQQWRDYRNRRNLTVVGLLFLWPRRFWRCARWTTCIFRITGFSWRCSLRASSRCCRWCGCCNFGARAAAGVSRRTGRGRRTWWRASASSAACKNIRTGDAWPISAGNGTAIGAGAGSGSRRW